jgi:hypothetical protein
MTRQADVVANTPILSTWGNTLRDRSVVPFTNAAQRTADWVSPPEGAVSYLADVDRLDVYTGAAWVQIPIGTTSGAWATWTPTWFGAGAALGNAAVSARYQRFGRTITGLLQIILGSTSAMATDTLKIALPTPAFDPGNNLQVIGSAMIDQSSVFYHGVAYIDFTSDTANDRFRLATGLKGVGNPILADPVKTGTPVVWNAASTDRLSVQFTYEAAT